NFSLHVGADADMTNKIGVGIKALDTAGLGIKGLNVKDTTGAAATYAIDSIADAIATVSSQRSLLGAVQNRLEHTINNLDNVVENTTSAESTIRDTDMATEMVKYSNANILSQAGQSMLAQGNQSNQGVLSLLG
ncbi:MAG: flagellar hook protein, partial [Lachnospiraceae bacterium]|nr:flagellar hook protein [Lachnospiraceae bacterium]